MSLMCNGVRNCVDGSDEGPGCTTTCSEADQARCSQTCQSTPQGPVRANQHLAAATGQSHDFDCSLPGCVHSAAPA